MVCITIDAFRIVAFRSAKVAKSLANATFADRKATMLTVLTAIMLLTSNLAFADTIVLRDLSLSRNVTVVSMEPDGLTTDAGQQIEWDQILQGEVAEDRQSRFDELLTTYGDPVYRIKQRVAAEDWPAAMEVALTLQRRLASDAASVLGAETEALVWAALYRGHLGTGDAAAAIGPFVELAHLQASLSETFFQRWPMVRLSDSERETMLSEEISPIWFDVDQSEQWLEAYKSRWVIKANDSAPGRAIYLASLAISAGQNQYASQLIDLIGQQNDQSRVWKTVLRWQLDLVNQRPRSIDDLFEATDGRSDALRAVSLYLSALPVIENLDAVTNSEDSPRRTQALMHLLTVVARWGDRYPELSAAAIFQAVKILGPDDPQSEVLRDELLKRFAKTYHGRMRSN